MAKTSYERLCYAIAEAAAEGIAGVEPEDLLQRIANALPQTQGQALEEDEAFRKELDAAELDAGKLRDPKDSPLGKLRAALHAEGLSIKCVLEAATAKITGQVPNPDRELLGNIRKFAAAMALLHPASSITFERIAQGLGAVLWGEQNHDEFKVAE